jgi:T4 RnlA family RNA ligase
MLDFDLVQQYIDQKYITVQKHPQADLWIYNYAQKTQFENFWNEITLKCRGLILDKNKEIVARPFLKFFNFDQHPPQDIPTTSFEVFEKMDGSLGILYWIENTPYIATRGSFNSEQAIKATEILHEQYRHTFEKLNKNYTYLFEIIYPENRIVVDYGNKKDLVLLAIIDKQTGEDIALQNIGFQIVKSYNGITEITKLQELAVENAEGFVIKFRNNFRVKIKFQEYIRLHRILTGVSNILIWEYLLHNKPFDELLEKVPDEFYDWVRITKNTLENEFATIEQQAKTIFYACPQIAENPENWQNTVTENRKAIANYFVQQAHTAILFAMLDKKNYAPIIWKKIRPVFTKPFKNSEE